MHKLIYTPCLLDAGFEFVIQTITALWPRLPGLRDHPVPQARKHSTDPFDSPIEHVNRHWRCKAKLMGWMSCAQAEHQCPRFMLIHPLLIFG